MIVFALLVRVNCKTKYIGPGFTVGDRYDNLYLTLFQVAAKLQEILCLASLSTILLQLLRHDLLYGDGTPLGLLSSHLWFSQPSSIVSPEYFAAALRCINGVRMFLLQSIKHWNINRENAARNWARTRLVVLLFILILLAALIGPFTAVLLIPRTQNFPAGGSLYFLDATAEDLWPNVVDSGAEFEGCSWANATEYSICPSGGYATLRGQRNFNSIYDLTSRPPDSPVDINLEYSNSLMLDPLGIMPAMYTTGYVADIDYTVSTYAAQPNAYSVILLQTLARDWISATWSEDVQGGFLSSMHEFKWTSPSAYASTTYPLSEVRCTQPQNLSVHAEAAQFRFIQNPSIMPYGWSDINTNITVSLIGLRREPTSHVRTQWIPLIIEDFGPVSIGLLFELPWSRPSESRLAIACTIAASWVEGPIARDEGRDYSAWYTRNDGATFHQGVTIGMGPNDPDAQSFKRHIQLSTDWLELLTPEAPDPPPTTDAWRPNTLENIFVSAGFETLMDDLRTKPRYIALNPGCATGMLDAKLSDADLWAAPVCDQYGKNDFVEWTIARLVSDGLSRRLSYRAFDTSLDLRSWIVMGPPREDDYNSRLMQGDPKKNAVVLPSDPGLVVQHLIITVKGLGYRISSTTEYLAMIVVGVYLSLSSIHVVWTLSHRITSSSWDTATELVLLAYNSPVSSALRGTSAQVHRWSTYNRIMRIRADHGDGDEADEKSHLRLRLLVDKPILDESEDEPPKSECRGRATQANIDVESSADSANSVTTSGEATGLTTYLRVEEGQKYY